MIALNATVDGNFSEYVGWPRIFFEGYLGYSWVFPKSPTSANVGIGWAGDERPDNYKKALRGAAERNGFPVPEDVNVDTIPRGPSLAPEQTAFPDDGVFLVGDAAGVANRYQGEGICQGIRSAYLLADLVGQNRAAEYPKELLELHRSEYRLAHILRGVWSEHTDAKLTAAVVDTLDGISIDEITRSPRAVAQRILSSPSVAVKILGNRGMLRRLYEGYTDQWEFTA